MSPSRATPVWARLLRHPSGRWAIAFIALLLLSATIGPRLTKYSGDEQLDVVHLANLPPSREHPMGTDRFSRDVLARMLRGAAISLAVATLAVALSITLGTAYGLVAGYAGGMPPYAQLSEDQTGAVISYLQSLAPGEGGGTP